MNRSDGSRKLEQIRDVVGRRIGKAARALRGQRAPSDEAVHEARKQLKRARAGLRLLREAVPAAAYTRENAALRDAARPLSLVRDARVMLDTHERLDAAGAGKRHQVGLRRALRMERRSLRREILQRPASRQRIVRDLVRAGHRVGRWRPEEGAERVVRAGARRIYRNGRKALARVATDPSVENLHELRKQLKYLGLAMATLRSIQIRHLKKPGRRAESIADLLGEGHDLAVLKEKIAALVPAVQEVPDALLSRISQRMKKLDQKAVQRAARFYAAKPKAFIERLF